jgi:uncharacterized protein
VSHLWNRKLPIFYVMIGINMIQLLNIFIQPRRMIVLLIVCMPLFNCAYSQSPICYFSIGAGPVSGSYFPIASLLASALTNPPGSPPCSKGGSCGVSNLIAFARVTEGAVQNIELLNQGKINSALAQADLLSNQSDLRVIANLFPEHLHIISKTPTTFDTIKTKKLCIGQRHSGSMFTISKIFNTLNLHKKNNELICGEPGIASDLLDQKELDAVIILGNYPILALESKLKNHRLHLLSLDNKHINKINKTYPVLTQGEIPKDLYNNKKAIQTIKVDSYLVVHKSLEDDLAYEITKALWQATNVDLFKRNRPHSQGFLIESAVISNKDMMHVGAKRYYDEKEIK